MRKRWIVATVAAMLVQLSQPTHAAGVPSLFWTEGQQQLADKLKKEGRCPDAVPLYRSAIASTDELISLLGQTISPALRSDTEARTSYSSSPATQKAFSKLKAMKAWTIEGRLSLAECYEELADKEAALRFYLEALSFASRDDYFFIPRAQAGAWRLLGFDPVK